MFVEIHILKMGMILMVMELVYVCFMKKGDQTMNNINMEKTKDDQIKTFINDLNYSLKRSSIAIEGEVRIGDLENGLDTTLYVQWNGNKENKIHFRLTTDILW
jgi:hypothetical protein